MDREKMQQQEVSVALRQHDRSTILLGAVVARGSTELRRVEVIASGNIVEIQVTSAVTRKTRGYRFKIDPFIEAANEMFNLAP